MLKSAKEGWLGISESGPEYAVARQQIASYIYQSSSRSRLRSTLQNLLESRSDRCVSDYLLDYMVSNTELIRESGSIRLNSDWIDKGEFGLIHSNIEAPPGITVVDAPLTLTALDPLVMITG